MKKLAAFLLGLVLAFNVAAEPHKAGVLSRTETGQYLKIADELSRYERPWIKQPIVVLMPNDEFVMSLCGLGGMIFGCPALGYFRPSDPNHVYIRVHDAISESLQKQVIVHEIVHWLQHQSGWIDGKEECREDYAQEVEAYQVSYLYGVLYLGLDEDFKIPSGVGCPPKD